MNHDVLDGRIDEQLRAAFAPLPRERLGELAASAVAGSAPRPLWPAWLIATAALCMLTWVLSRPAASAPPTEDTALGAMWAAAFDDAVQRGFANCCASSCGGGCGVDGFDVDQACQQRYDVRLRMATGASVQLLGAYQGLPTGGCMALLANSEATPVMLCVVPRGEDRNVRLPADRDLQLVRREVGTLVLYALYRSPGSRALDGFIVQ